MGDTLTHAAKLKKNLETADNKISLMCLCSERLSWNEGYHTMSVDSREKSCTMLKQSSQRKCHLQKQSVTENSKMITQAKRHIVELKSQTRDIFASAFYLHSVCTHLPTQAQAPVYPCWKFPEVRERGRRENKDKYFCRWIGTPHFIGSQLSVNPSYSQHSWELRNKFRKPSDPQISVSIPMHQDQALLFMQDWFYKVLSLDSYLYDFEASSSLTS